MNINVTVDETHVELPEGSSVLDAILAAGVYLPHLCKDVDRPALGTCRTCLVGIEGRGGCHTACTEPATEGMVVHTNDPEAVDIRTGVLQLTADMLPEPDPHVLGELSLALQTHGVLRGRFLPSPQVASRRTVDDSNPFWLLDHNRCILCERCIDACQEVQHIGAIAKLSRGAESTIGTFGYGSIADSNCTSCGQCWSVCPTLAIRQKQTISAGARRGWAVNGAPAEKEE